MSTKIQKLFLRKESNRPVRVDTVSSFCEFSFLLIFFVWTIRLNDGDNLELIGVGLRILILAFFSIDSYPPPRVSSVYYYENENQPRFFILFFYIFFKDYKICHNIFVLNISRWSDN